MSFDTRNFGRWSHKATTEPDPRWFPAAAGPAIDPETRKRAAKVWRLYRQPGTEGERTAARGRLEEMAQRHSMPFERFAAACGIWI
jgi:hypothetical protein